MVKVRCPVCDRWIEGRTPQDLPFLPFCGDRCKLIDLGRWLGGQYALPASDAGQDEEFDSEPGPLAPS